MLQLVSTQKPGVSYPLLVDTTYTVGRKQGDITFPDDQSVSRVHAEVVVEHPAGNINEPLLTPVLTLQDAGSKFGTFATEDNINSKTAINARERVTLSVGDKLRFGLQWNEYKVDYTPLVVTSSSFKPTPAFKSRIIKLGGHFITEWNGYVTHVVMESLTLTVKAVCALLAAKPIVKPAYLTEVVSAFETNKTPPGPEGFLPPISEMEKGLANLENTCFHPNTSRTTLFAGKTFLFCTTKHLKKLAVAIEAGGGIAKLVTDAAGENVLNNEYIIMGHPLDVADGEKDGRTKAILDVYKKGGKRLIADSEIGLAAVHNSIDKHCNPKSSMVNAVLPNIISQTQRSSGSSVPLVPETQDVESQGNGDTSRNVVNETVIKQEDGETGKKDTVQKSQTTRGEKRGVADTGSSSSKKRSAEESLTSSNFKRMKEVSPSSNTSKPASQKSNASRALNSLFNFSSDEDEEDDIVAVPETQPEQDAGANDDVEVVPESQMPQVSVVDVRNLQSVESTQESLATRPGEDVFRVPASPITVEESSDDEIRDHGTDFIETVTTSVMNAKTVPVPDARKSDEATINVSPRNDSRRGKKPSQPPNKSLNDSTAEQGPSRKRRREGDDSLVEETKKINLNEIPKKMELAEACAKLPFVKRPLVNKNTTRDISILASNDSSGSSNKTNYKSFRKVPPSFIDSSKCQENRNSGQSNDGWIDTTNDYNVKPVKLTTYHYWPGATNYRAGTIPPPLDPQPERGMDLDTPEGFITFNDTTNYLTNILEREKKTREDAERQKEKAKQSTPPIQDEPSTSGGRRTSPRKKGPAVKLPPPPPPPQPMQVDVEDEEEDEDDMWTFNR